MATYAIGDIQGCFDSFRRLLDLVRFDPAHDRLWLVGDLVNRGPHSLETLRFVKGLGESAITVLGNHDLHLLMLSEGYSKKHHDDTVDAILAAHDREVLLDWLRRCPMMHVEDGHALVHAGLLPQWPVAQAQRLAGEVEAALQAENYRDFLANMWGSEPPSWRDDLASWPRLRVIVNAMTRMRFCSLEGVMEFKAKGELADAPAGYLPWFAVPGRKSADHVLVTGHWSALGLRIEPNLLALDSGCLWGRHLTAVRLPEREVFQIDCAGEDVT
ncbi:MAG: symmetrical bis(5'-nucleosyl)-tetraphosphatase [Rhodocyclaceae bacterium]|nr:MAG: symmetrical bis(5'-nucleosyl)-tetraphosphatase [Rhodocyclaceae bacterium]MCG3168308.1 Bis(5'-nucleosyl)-tetraphosphatase, symmetrical [Bacteroidia bacterium]CAG0927294.1 bis(5'-nucleosyl)-tetraphosphatase (symmetrical) [Rhodocyclaceae bacterium]